MDGRGSRRRSRNPGRHERRSYRDATYRRSLAVADVASAAVALASACHVLGEDAINPLALLAVPLVVLVSKVSGLYERDENRLRKDTLDEMPALLQVATLYTFVIWLAGDAIVDGQFGRDQALGRLGAAVRGMFAARALARQLPGARTAGRAVPRPRRRRDGGFHRPEAREPPA